MGLITLKPKKAAKIKSFKFATSDIEAYSWTNFMCIGFYDIFHGFYDYFLDLDEYLDFMYDYCYQWGLKNTFFQFGGIYDFMFLFQKLFFSDRFLVENIIPRGSGILCFTIIDTHREHEDSKGKPYKLTVWDSSALLPYGLDNLSKSFNVEHKKLKIEHDKFEEMWKTEDGKLEILEYLEYDCRAHAEVLKKFYEWPLIKQAGPAYTISSQALKMWQLFLDREVYSLPDSIDNFVRNSYLGGRTEVFKPIFLGKYDIEKNPSKFNENCLRVIKEHIKIGQISYLDVNSLYPTVMRENDFPVGAKGDITQGKNYNPDELGVWRVKVDVPKSLKIPPLGVKVKIKKNQPEKLIYPTGTFTGYFTNVELEYAKTLGVKVIKVYEGVKFVNGGKIFRRFIDTLYNMRLEAKAKGDSVGDLLTKLIMNSCYGKTGMSKDGKEKLILEDGGTGGQEFVITDEYGIRTATLRKVPSKLDNIFSNVGIATFVTSYARVHMHKIFMQCGPENVFYTDTDSVFTSYKGLPTGPELGQLKVEYNAKSACFLLPKTYSTGDIVDLFDKEGNPIHRKLTMKGFNNKEVQSVFSIDDFVNYLRGEAELTLPEKPKFSKFKTGLHKGNFLTMSYEVRSPEEQEKLRRIDEKKEENYFKKHGVRKKFVKKQYKYREKAVKSLYDKRVITDDGTDTRPIHLIDGLLTEDYNNV